MGSKQQSQLYASRLGGGGGGGGSGEYHHHHHHHPSLATAASFSSATTKKWALNAKNDVVEVGDQPHGYGGGHFLIAGSGAANFSATAATTSQGFLSGGGECGRAGGSTATTGSVLTRYNSAPSCLFSDLDQIARSLNEVAPAANPTSLFDLPPLPSSAMAMSLDRRNSPDLFPGKKKIVGGSGSPPSYSAQSSTSLAMDFGVVDHHHQRQQQQQQHQNGFTGLLTGTGSTSSSCAATIMKKTSAAPPAMSIAAATPAANLTRQSSSPTSLLSRLEIDRVGAQQYQQHGSSEEDSLEMRSPIDGMDQEVMVAGVSGAMDLGTVSSVDCGFWDASSMGLHAGHPAAAAAATGAAQLHGTTFLGNGNASSDQAGRKRIRDVEMDMLDVAMDHSSSSGGGGGGGGGSHQQQQQQQPQPQAQHHTLTRHLSLPISTGRSGGGLLAAENLLQDSVPCRLRAKRGCATHPRSIAERVRRTRISERMRRLQELVPNMDKQTNTSDMLDEAVEYMKFLQKQVDDFQDCREKCQGLCRMSQQQKNTGSSGSQ